MLAIAIASLFAVVTVSVICSLIHSVAGGLHAGRAIMAELAAIRQAEERPVRRPVAVRRERGAVGRRAPYVRQMVRLRPTTAAA